MFDPGRITTVTVEGKIWKIGRLERSVIFAFRDWLREQIGDPFAVVDRLKAVVPIADLMERVKEAEGVARDLAHFSLGTATAKTWLHTEIGMSKLIHLLILPHHPDATEDDAFRVLAALGSDELGKTIARAAGEAPGGNGSVPATAGLTGGR